MLTVQYSLWLVLVRHPPGADDCRIGFSACDDTVFRWLAFVLAGVVADFLRRAFYRGACGSSNCSSNMDTLVALGSTTAFGFNCLGSVQRRGGHVYFMEAGRIISLISAGHWLEARVSTKASGALIHC